MEFLEMDAPLHKEPAILDVLRRLQSRFGSGAFVVADHWEQDLCAVGIADPCEPGLLVYISIFGEEVGRFGYELELPPPPGCETPYQVAGRGSGLSFEELTRVVAKHLKLGSYRQSR
jgi:hypothetical protein